MCRSSRFLAFLLALIAIPTLAEAGGISARVGFGARPGFAVGPRFAFRPGFGRAGFARPGFARPGFARPGFARPGYAGGFRGPWRFGRFGRGFGNLGVYGGAVSMLDLDTPPLSDDGYGLPPQPEPVAMPPAPPPCIRPLIILVGKGLRRPARTKVVYGSQPPCGY